MRGVIIVPFLLLLIILSNYLGNIFPPTSIMLMPFLMPIVTLACLKISDLSLAIRVLIITLFIVLNDYLIRTYAGGTHDSEGNGVIILMFLISNFISAIIFFNYIIKRKLELKKPFLYLIISIILLLAYFKTCGTYGMARIERASQSIKLSKESGKYPGQLNISENLKIDRTRYEKTIRIYYKYPIRSKETQDLYLHVRLNFTYDVC